MRLLSKFLPAAVLTGWLYTQAISAHDAEAITVNNRLRGVVEATLSGLKLFSSDRALRLAAATDLLKTAGAAQTPLISKALAAEKDADIQAVLKQIVATANLHAPDATTRKTAVKALAETTNASQASAGTDADQES